MSVRRSNNLSVAATAMVFLAWAAFAAGPPAPSPPIKTLTPVQSSTSGTGQFTIHGMDLATRGAFCLMCDEVAAALGRLLRDDAHFLLPVVVVLKTPSDSSLNGPAVTWNISQLSHGGFHLQINATLRSDFRSDDFAREIVRVLLAERILRNHKELKTSRQNVLPNWVLTGVTNALEFRGRSRPSLLFAAVFRSGLIYSVDKILSADPSQLDALARGVYETSACTLVLALLDQQDGPLRFAKFLDTLARNDKLDRDLLRQYFPTLGASKNSLEKWWSLQMATLATPSPLESLGVDETEARLRDALTLVLDPLPEKEKKKKGGSSAASNTSSPSPGPAAKPEPDDSKKEEKKRSIFGNLFGGKKIMWVPVDHPEVDDSGSCANEKTDETPAPAGKSDASKKNEKDSAAKTKSVAKEPAKKPDANSAAPATQEEKAEPEPKRSMLNPRNWFRKKEGETPAEEAPNKEPPKKEAVITAKESPPPTKKPKETPAAPARQDSPPPIKPESSEKRPQGLTIEEFATVWKREDRDRIFQQTINRLNALKVQAHPLYRPLIGEYIATIRFLVAGKQRGIAEKLAGLREERAKVYEQARAVETHLDWYEASQTRSYSGTFDDYLKLCDQLDRESRVRNDAISKYLDLLAKEYD